MMFRSPRLSRPIEHPSNLHWTRAIEQLTGGIKRCTAVVGIFPDDDATLCLAQRLSKAPLGRSASVAAAAERFDRLLAAKIGTAPGRAVTGAD